MQPKNSNQLADKLFDLLVIGGGINGLGIAWDASLRGLSTALVEKGSFGGGATAGCFGIVHGGLRYLQHLDFDRLRRSVREQQILRRIAPGLVRPLPVLVPCYGRGAKGREFLRLGMHVYEFLSRNRNAGVPRETFLPPHRVLSTDEVLAQAPGIRTEGLRGGVIFYDARMESCEQLTLAVARSAETAGAALGSGLELMSARRGTVGEWIAVIRDVNGGGTFEIRARAIVTACGPWGDEVRKRLGFAGALPKRRYVRGTQLILPPIISQSAVAVESSGIDRGSLVRRGGRSYFLMPVPGATLAGTFEALPKNSAEEYRPDNQEVTQFVDELRASYCDERLSVENVRSAWGGLIPLEDGGAGEDYRVERTDRVTEVSRDGIFIDVLGVKYTTFRALAERVVDLVVGRLQIATEPCATSSIRLAEADQQHGRGEVYFGT